MKKEINIRFILAAVVVAFGILLIVMFLNLILNRLTKGEFSI